MSKINPSTKKVSTSKKFDTTECLAGGFGQYAAKQTDIQLLRRMVLANLLWEDNFYIDGKSVSDEIKRLIPLCNAEDVYRLAYEARNMQKLRHIPLFIACEMCKYPSHRKLVSKLLPLIITRVDMMMDFLAIYWTDGKKPICNQAKKGLAKCFHNFDEYQFAKYDRDLSIKLRDVMFLTHPKPNNKEEEELFNRIAERKLKTPETWEVFLSSGADKVQTWTKLITENKLGAMALLRNIRNMRDSGVPKYIINLGISNIRSSMLLPLDFIKAYENAPEFKNEIEKAMISCYSNLPKLKGKTLFIVDVSGSMVAPISYKTKYTRLKAAEAMAILAANQCEKFKLVATAGSDYYRKHSTKEIKNPQKGFGLIDQIDKAKVELGGGGIFTRQCLEWCRENFKGEQFDRIIIFSDSQDCDYPEKRVPKPFGKYNYICDVSSEKRGINYEGIWTSEISGFSEHFLTFISVNEGNINLFGED